MPNHQILAGYAPGINTVRLHKSMIKDQDHCKSRHTVVSRAAQGTGTPHPWVLTGRTKTSFSHLCISVITYPDWNQICYTVARQQGESTFQIWRKSLQPFPRYELPKFRGFFSHTCKNCYNKQTHTPIAMKFGTQKGSPKANPSIKFGTNPMNGSGVITDYSSKARSICCHAYRVNRFMEWVENCYVDGVTIVGVPFGGLKGIEIKTMEIWHKTQPVSQLRDRFLWIKKY